MLTLFRAEYYPSFFCTFATIALNEKFVAKFRLFDDGIKKKYMLF